MLADTPTPPDALLALRRCLQQGLENPYGLEGTVSWSIDSPEAQAHWHLVVTLKPLTVGAWQPGLAPEGSTAAIRLSLDSAELIMRNIHAVNFRDPHIIGRLHLTGEPQLFTHGVKALLVPSASASSRLNGATQRKAPAYNSTQVERVHQPSEMEILQRVADGQPFVATGIAPNDDEGGWTLERLTRRFGTVPLRVRSADWQETVGEFVQRLHTSPSASTDAAPLVEGFTKLYTEGCPLPEAMRADFMPHRMALDDFDDPQIWFGAVPVNIAASCLHRDIQTGFLFQIMGRKKLVLYSPDQAPLLYPLRSWSSYQPCWVEPSAPRLDLFPAFAQARPLEITLHPGELLIQPTGWFHAVYCLDTPTFSVSYFLRH